MSQTLSKTRNWRALSAIAVGLALLTSAPASAQAPELSEAQRAEAQARMEEFRTRLNLSEDQEAALTPILAESQDKRRAVFQSYGISEGERPRLSFRQMRSLRSEMQDIQKTTLSDASAILTDDQMREFEAIQDEARERMRDRLRNGSS